MLRRFEPFLHLGHAGREKEDVPLQSVKLVHQRQQAEQNEAEAEQMAAQHQTGAHEEIIGAADDDHRAGHRDRFRDWHQQGAVTGGLLFQDRLGVAQFRGTASLRGLANGSRAPLGCLGKRFHQTGGQALVDLGDLPSAARQPAVDETDCQANAARQKQRDECQRPGDDKQRRHIEQTDATALDDEQKQIDGANRARGFTKADIRQFARGALFKQIQLRVVEFLEKGVTQIH